MALFIIANYIYQPAAAIFAGLIGWNILARRVKLPVWRLFGFIYTPV